MAACIIVSNNEDGRQPVPAAVAHGEKKREIQKIHPTSSLSTLNKMKQKHSPSRTNKKDDQKQEEQQRRSRPLDPPEQRRPRRLSTETPPKHNSNHNSNLPLPKSRAKKPTKTNHRFRPPSQDEFQYSHPRVANAEEDHVLLNITKRYAPRKKQPLLTASQTTRAADLDDFDDDVQVPKKSTSFQSDPRELLQVYKDLQQKHHRGDGSSSDGSGLTTQQEETVTSITAGGGSQGGDTSSRISCSRDDVSPNINRNNPKKQAPSKGIYIRRGSVEGGNSLGNTTSTSTDASEANTATTGRYLRSSSSLTSEKSDSPFANVQPCENEDINKDEDGDSPSAIATLAPTLAASTCTSTSTANAPKTRKVEESSLKGIRILNSNRTRLRRPPINGKYANPRDGRTALSSSSTGITPLSKSISSSQFVQKQIVDGNGQYPISSSLPTRRRSRRNNNPMSSPLTKSCTQPKIILPPQRQYIIPDRSSSGSGSKHNVQKAGISSSRCTI